MKKLQDELLLSKVGAWNLMGELLSGLLLRTTQSHLIALPTLHRSSSWLRWNGCRWRLTSYGGGPPPPIPGDGSPPILSLGGPNSQAHPLFLSFIVLGTKSLALLHTATKPHFPPPH